MDFQKAYKYKSYNIISPISSYECAKEDFHKSWRSLRRCFGTDLLIHFDNNDITITLNLVTSLVRFCRVCKIYPFLTNLLPGSILSVSLVDHSRHSLPVLPFYRVSPGRVGGRSQNIS